MAANIVLIGFRGSGKTTVGRELAGRLGLEFIDTDEEIERAAGKTVAGIFEEEGEPGFRKREREEVLRACSLRGHVIAVGGGAVENGELAAAMKGAGTVVLLSAPAAVLHGRMALDGTSPSRRPALTSSGGLEEVEELLERRREAYHGTADFEIDTEGLSPSEVAERIMARVVRP
jgi:shikimate kinase